MQGEGFAGAAFVFIQRMEAAQVGIVEAGPQVVLAEIIVPPFSSVEVRSGKEEGRRLKEIAVGVVGEGVGDVTFQVSEGPDMATSVVNKQPIDPFT